MPPHSLALTMVGAGLLWVGWFGFNAGSALEANGLAAVAMINTFVAPAAGAARLDGRRSGWCRASRRCSAALRARSPGWSRSRRRPESAGRSARCCSALAASLVCYGFVGSLKNRLRLDDSLDVFGIHGLGGIAGSIGTAIVALPALGGHGGAGLCARPPAGRGSSRRSAVAIAWSAAGSALCFGAVKLVMPLRHAPRCRARGPRHRRPWRARVQLLSSEATKKPPEGGCLVGCGGRI